MTFKEGDVFYMRIGLGEPYKCCVVAIVDGDQVVYKWYGRHRQWWHYDVVAMDILEMRVVEKDT